MTENHKKIGLPCLGTKAKQFYELRLNYLYQEKYGADAQCPLEFINIDFDKINALLPDQYDALLPLLKELIEVLENTNINIILIPNITLHTVLDKLEISLETKSRIVDPIVTGIQALNAENITQITLAGTRYTMQTEQIAQYFEQTNIKVLRPDENDIKQIDKIRLEVFKSGYANILKAEMLEVFKRYSNVVIACTELSILNSENDYCDLARLQIEKAISGL